MTRLSRLVVNNKVQVPRIARRIKHKIVHIYNRCYRNNYI